MLTLSLSIEGSSTLSFHPSAPFSGRLHSAFLCFLMEFLSILLTCSRPHCSLLARCSSDSSDECLCSRVLTIPSLHCSSSHSNAFQLYQKSARYLRQHLHAILHVFILFGAILMGEEIRRGKNNARPRVSRSAEEREKRPS